MGRRRMVHLESFSNCRVGPGRLHPAPILFGGARADLITPRSNFPGLEEGDRWCLRKTRWKEALEASVALRVDLEATHSYVREFVSLEDLQAHALSSH